jgi:hypothetical protein
VNTDDFLAAAVRYVREHYQQWPKSIRIELSDGQKMALLVPTKLCKEAEAPRVATVEGVDEDLAQAIFFYLEDEGERRTRDEVAKALEDQFSSSAVHKALWKMRVAGVLTNPKRAGYGLADWK